MWTVCEQSAYLVFSVNVQIIDLFNLIYRIKNIETDRRLQIFFLYLLESNEILVIALFLNLLFTQNGLSVHIEVIN